MHEALVFQFLNVDCREGLQGLDARGEIDALEFDEYVLFSIYTERDWFCFETVSTELREFQHTALFLYQQVVFYDHDDHDQFYLEK